MLYLLFKMHFLSHIPIDPSSIGLQSINEMLNNNPMRFLKQIILIPHCKKQWNVYRKPNIEPFTTPLVLSFLLHLPLLGMLFPFISDNENLANFWDPSQMQPCSPFCLYLALVLFSTEQDMGHYLHWGLRKYWVIRISKLYKLKCYLWVCVLDLSLI